MPQKPKILAFAGSARSGSLNKQLIGVAARAATAGGGEVTLIDLRDYPLPVYDGDLEAAEGIPANAKKLKALFIEHQALLISSLLKNTIDWISRQDGDVSGLVPYQNKVAGLLTASPSVRGGVRGIPHLRAILDALGVLVLPGHVGIPHADKAFGPEGSLLDARQQSAVAALGERLVDACKSLHG